MDETPVKPEPAEEDPRAVLVPIEVDIDCGCRYVFAERLRDVARDIAANKHGDIGDALPELLQKIAAVILTASEDQLLACMNKLEPQLSIAAGINARAFLTYLQSRHPEKYHPFPPVVDGGTN